MKYRPSAQYVIKIRERHDAGFWGPWAIAGTADSEGEARRIADDLGVNVLEDIGIFYGRKRLNKPLTKDQRIRELEERLASAECVIRQVARDTWGRDMTVKEFAERSSYDS